MRMQTYRWTELLQMLEVTYCARKYRHSHVGRQALGEVHYCFVDVFLWQLFPDNLQGDLQLISHLRLWLQLCYFSSMASET